MMDGELKEWVASMAAAHKQANEEHKQARLEMQEIRDAHKQANEEDKQARREEHEQARLEMQEIRDAQNRANEEDKQARGEEYEQARLEMQEIRDAQNRANEEDKEARREEHEQARLEMQEIRDAQNRANEEDKQARREEREQARLEMQENWKMIKKLGKQIGGLGQKFGSFTEGLALPSMQKILRKQFKMEVISPSVLVRKAGKEIEIDVLAYANSDVNEVYVVEVKSHLREEGIRQLQEIMSNFRRFFPEHRNKKAFGIIAAVHMTEDLKQRVLSQGFYAAKIKDDLFSLDAPKKFKPKAF